MNPPTRLHLVSPPHETESFDSVHEEPLSPETSQAQSVLLGIEQLMERQAGVVPDDPAILIWAWPSHLASPTEQSLRAAIETLLFSGGLRRIYLGTEAHLTTAPRPRSVAPPSTPAPRHSLQVSKHATAAAAAATPKAPERPSWSLSSQAFELQVEMDVEHERMLLFRILTTVSLVAALVLAREVALVFLGL